MKNSKSDLGSKFLYYNQANHLLMAQLQSFLPKEWHSAYQAYFTGYYDASKAEGATEQIPLATVRGILAQDKVLKVAIDAVAEFFVGENEAATRHDFEQAFYERLIRYREGLAQFDEVLEVCRIFKHRIAYLGNPIKAYDFQSDTYQLKDATWQLDGKAQRIVINQTYAYRVDADKAMVYPVTEAPYQLTLPTKNNVYPKIRRCYPEVKSLLPYDFVAMACKYPKRYELLQVLLDGYYNDFKGLNQMEEQGQLYLQCPINPADESKLDEAQNSVLDSQIKTTDPQLHQAQLSEAKKRLKTLIEKYHLQGDLLKGLAEDKIAYSHVMAYGLYGRSDELMKNECFEMIARRIVCSKKQRLIYHMIEQADCLIYLYVSDNPADWPSERLKDGYINAYVCRRRTPNYSLSADIQLKAVHGVLQKTSGVYSSNDHNKPSRNFS